MKRKISLLIYSLITSGLASAIAFAQDEPAPEVDSDALWPLMPNVFISTPITSEIELGIGYVSDDAYKFGRYNGMQTDTAFLLGDIRYREYYEGGGFLSVRGISLGLESRYLRLETGEPGSVKIFIQYDELPNYKDNTVATPFIGAGTDTLALPAGFDIDTNLDANLNNFELKTKRERLVAGASIIPDSHWQFDINISHETKQGIDATGAATANGVTQIIGNTTYALLPEPIDYDTDIINATLRYAGDDGQLDLTYHVSLFDNNNDALSWQDPFNPLVASGNMSLEPDNEFHQLSLTGGYSLPYSSRLTGLLSIGRITQNQSFEPYTVNTALVTSPLPRDSLEGKVWLANAQLKLTSRPLTKLRLSAELRYNERSDKTPVDLFSYVVLDSHLGGPVQNRPYSYTSNQLNLDGNYRFNALTSLQAGYKRDDTKRSYINAERENTQEDTIFAKWKIKPVSSIDIALYAEAASRDGSDYDTLANENPALRKFYLADRERTKLGARVDYMATESLFLAARADYNQDDYENSTIGLTASSQPVLSVDFSYQLAKNITTYGYYTYEHIQSSQAGESFSMATASNWEANFDDAFNTAGLGARMNGLGKWDVGVDLVRSESSGNIELRDLAAIGTETQFPDITTALTSLKLWTRYNHSKHLAYKLGFRFENYSADNWAVDGLQPYDPAVVRNALLLGNETLDYNVYVITVSASYKFQ